MKGVKRQAQKKSAWRCSVTRCKTITRIQVWYTCKSIAASRYYVLHITLTMHHVVYLSCQKLSADWYYTQEIWLHVKIRILELSCKLSCSRSLLASLSILNRRKKENTKQQTRTCTRWNNFFFHVVQDFCFSWLWLSCISHFLLK